MGRERRLRPEGNVTSGLGRPEVGLGGRGESRSARPRSDRSVLGRSTLKTLSFLTVEGDPSPLPAPPFEPLHRLRLCVASCHPTCESLTEAGAPEPFMHSAQQLPRCFFSLSTRQARREYRLVGRMLADAGRLTIATHRLLSSYAAQVDSIAKAIKQGKQLRAISSRSWTRRGRS